MANSATAPPLHFGLEMEMLVSPKTSAMRDALTAHGWDHQVRPSSTDEAAKEQNRLALRKAIAQAISGVGIETALRAIGYSIWVVVDEPSLDEIGDYCKSLESQQLSVFHAAFLT